MVDEIKVCVPPAFFILVTVMLMLVVPLIWLSTSGESTPPIWTELQTALSLSWKPEPTKLAYGLTASGIVLIPLDDAVAGELLALSVYILHKCNLCRTPTVPVPDSQGPVTKEASHLR